MDDKNDKDLNVSWQRLQIGLVSHEPVMFSTTIQHSNIMYWFISFRF